MQEGSQEPTWQFNPEEATPPNEVTEPKTESVSWSAAEFVDHKKNIGWYFLLTLAAAAITAVVFLVTQDKISTITMAVALLIFGIIGARKPKTIDYKVDEQGVTIGQRFFPWATFKSFAILEDGPADSIFLTPLKRFMPAVNVHYDPKDEQRIINVLGAYLPHEDRDLDFVDRLMHKIRF